MPVNVLSQKNSLINLINKNNTTTSSYDVSASLNKRVTDVIGSSAARVPVIAPNYPIVFVELESIVDNHTELGLSSRRDVDMQFKITSVTDYGIGTADYEDTDDEMIQLTQNLDYLLRSNIKISNTCDSCLITGTNFITDEGTYNARSETTLIIKKRG